MIGSLAHVIRPSSSPGVVLGGSDTSTAPGSPASDDRVAGASRQATCGGPVLRSAPTQSRTSSRQHPVYCQRNTLSLGPRSIPDVLAASPKSRLTLTAPQVGPSPSQGSYPPWADGKESVS